MSEQHKVTLLMTEFVTHDVKRFIVSRPPGFRFEPGQGVELAIDQPDWREEGRPFTPTSLNDAGVLEFTIKGYPDHQGVTRELHNLKPGAELLMTDPFGTISFQGPGVFLAGGAGITPFIAILRERFAQGQSDANTLIFSNKTPADIICERELRHYLGERCILTCTDSSGPGYDNRRIDRAFLEEQIDNFDQNFYVCGPPPFMDSINSALEALGASGQNLIFEK